MNREQLHASMQTKLLLQRAFQSWEDYPGEPKVKQWTIDTARLLTRIGMESIALQFLKLPLTLEDGKTDEESELELMTRMEDFIEELADRVDQFTDRERLQDGMDN